MYKKTWDKNTLEDLKKELLLKSRTSTDRAQLKEAIEFIEEIIIDLEDDGIIDRINGHQELTRNSKICNRNQKYNLKIALFNNIVASYQDSLLEMNTVKNNKDFTIDDYFSLTHDFYKSLDEDLFRAFLITFDERKNNINFTKPKKDDYFYGGTWFVPGIKKSFIDISNNGDYESLLTVIHEYGHTVTGQINPNRLTTNGFLSEIETYFLELIAEDYFEYSLSSDYFIDTRLNKYNIMFGKSEDLLDMVGICNDFKTIDCVKRAKIKEIASKLDVDRYTLELLLCNDYEQDYNRIMSFIVAVNLYKIYKKDPEFALNELKRIIKLSNDTSEYRFLKEKNYIDSNNTEPLLKQTLKRKRNFN